MSIWEAFGMGRHKGFSREAGLLLDEAVELARLMVSIGTAHGRKVAALITDMDTPLGHNTWRW